MDEQIEGVPYGWRLVRIGYPKAEDWFMDEDDGRPGVSSNDWNRGVRVIIEKIEQEKQYRQFANAAEFAPHRDRWWRYKDDHATVSRPPANYSDSGHYGYDYEYGLERKVFDDGSPFGVEVTE